MESVPTDSTLLAEWGRGRPDAADVLFHRFRRRLLALVRSRLSGRLGRRVDPEDVVLSAYRSFFLAARDGKFVTEGEGLWPLLATLTLRKLARQARRHSAGCRSIRAEETPAPGWAAELTGGELGGEAPVILADEVERLLERLDETGRAVLVDTLAGDDAETIAANLGVSDRTVRRALERIRRAVTTDAVGPPTTLDVPSSGPHEAPLRYEDFLLKKLIGAGAFSKVFRAVDRRTGEEVAVKFLRRESWPDPRARRVLVHEWTVLRELSHPGILKTHGWGSTPAGGLFLVTELTDAGSLETWRLAGPRPLREILPKGVAIAAALEAAHRRGVLHGDLKPANVLLRDTGAIVLGDFGFARWLQAPDDVPAGGTLGFLSPEQLSPAFGPVTERSDVYGFGCLLYTLLTGHPPLAEGDANARVAAILSDAQPPAASQRCPDLRPAVDRLVMNCLMKDPQRRYADAGTLHAAISQLVASDPDI